MGEQVQLEVARAVARADRARLLTATNVAAQSLPLAQAVRSRQAFFVTPRPDLLVVDLDLPDDPTLSADATASFEALVTAGRECGVPVTRVPSGRPGHEHAYLVTGTGAARLRLERWCKDHGLDVRTHGVRPPGAPHRLGMAVLATAQLPAILDVLRRDVDVAATGRLAAVLCPFRLPGRVRVAVQQGHQRAGYATASHGRMALAVAVRARGGSPGLLEAVLRDPASPLGQTFRDRPGSWQQAELGRIWAKAGAWIASQDRVSADVADVEEAAAGALWSGVGGASDLAVLEELVRLARRLGTRTVGVALCDLGVGAGVSTDTARAAVRRLVRGGWLRVVALETARTTRTYELRVPAGSARQVGARVPDRDTFGDLGSDLARWRALGKSSMRVARQVAIGAGQSTSALALALHSTPAAIRHHLRKLQAQGLVVLVGDGWVARTARRRLAALERCLGVAGARRMHAAQVARGRAARARELARFASVAHDRRRERASSPPGP